MGLTLIATLIGVSANFTVDRLAASRPLTGCCWYGAWVVICTVTAAVDAATGDWSWALLMAACAVINGIRCYQHWNRRKRKRTAALAGAKSRARLAALLRKQRETARPRQVLRPVPSAPR